jgi:hypothetical protein
MLDRRRAWRTIRSRMRERQTRQTQNNKNYRQQASRNFEFGWFVVFRRCQYSVLSTVRMASQPQIGSFRPSGGSNSFSCTIETNSSNKSNKEPSIIMGATKLANTAKTNTTASSNPTSSIADGTAINAADASASAAANKEEDLSIGNEEPVTLALPLAPPQA